MTPTALSHSVTALAGDAAMLAGPIVAAVGGIDPDSVIRAARRLHPHARGGVRLVAVAEPAAGSVVGPEPVLFPQDYFDSRRKELETELRDRLKQFGGCVSTWEPHIATGLPAPALTNYARTANASLLVMGLGRHRALDRVMGKETTLHAIELARCPVLAVHPDLDAPFRDVVVATDFSTASTFAARAVLPLLAANATVHLVHVWQPSMTTDVHATAADERYLQSLPAHFRRLESTFDQRPDVEVKAIVREGKPAECVIDYARAHHADLVVAGRRGLNLLHRVFVGSQTTAMLRRTSCSLLVVPERLASSR